MNHYNNPKGNQKTFWNECNESISVINHQILFSILTVKTIPLNTHFRKEVEMQRSKCSSQEVQKEEKG